MAETAGSPHKRRFIMTDNVVSFNGVTTLKGDPDITLKFAAGNLETVVIIGYDKDGEFYFASSEPSGAEVNLLLDIAKNRLINLID
jgi:hypothetical protein